jgi:prephenate dehydrogenase
VGAVAVELDAQTHDRLVAQVSHVPQLVASALAAAMDADGGAAALASNGFRDTTRVADSPPGLWGEVVSANREGVAAALDRVLAPLHRLRELLAVEADDADLTAEVHRLVTAGHAGRALLPGKHGRPARMWASVSVAIPDEAGALARLLADIAHAAVNVEDLRLEHAPGRPRGLAELAVAPADRDGLLAALAAQGWTAVAGPEAPL